ncbi:VCBS repeat-containing protein [bacterium]|nr:VCBS repeat-containing protein [bacterium]
MKTKTLLTLTFLPFLLQTNLFAQFGFRELHVFTGAAQLETTALDSRGAGWGDFNNDGWLDLYVANFGNPNEVYLNNANPDPFTGAVTFTNISLTSGADFSGNSVAVSIADYNNDGYDDIFVATQNQGHKLFKNLANNTFLDVSSNLSISENATSAVWGDVNNDGFVDLCVGVLNAPMHVFQNNVGISFTEVTTSIGITGVKGIQNIVITDVNKDGLIDLYLVKGASVLDQTNEIYVNISNVATGVFAFQQQNANFGSIGSNASSFAADFSDLDNDGDFDLYIGNDGQNQFLRNLNSNFTDQTTITGTGSTAVTKGVSLSDLDLNGFNDVFIFNQGVNPKIWLNSGSTFTDQFSDLLGSQGYSAPGNENGICHADFDNDGDVDYFVPVSNGMNLLFRNNCIANQNPTGKGQNEANIIFCGFDNWLGVNLQGTQSNFRGIGARVVFKKTGGNLVREVNGTGNPGSQSSYRIEVGFGSSVAVVDTIQVYWPSGIIQNVLNVPTNQIITIVEKNCLNRFVDVTFEAGLGNSTTAEGLGAAWGDYDNDGDLDLINIKGGDFFLFQNNGNETFTSLPSSVTGLVPVGGTTRKATLFVDFNNDGLLDILIGKNVFIHQGMSVSPVYQMVPTINFTDVNGGDAFTGPTVGVSALDYDNDSFLDFYVARASLSADQLFHNGGPIPPTNAISFNDVAPNLNLVKNNYLDWFTHSVTCVDYDENGWVDIYAGHDNHNGQTNLMFRNNGLNSSGVSLPFSDVTYSLGVHHNNTWGSCFGDYNNDGLIDIFISATDFFSSQIYNVLYKHNLVGSTHSFTNLAQTAGVAGTVPTQTWESGWADIDNDGWLDLFVGNVNFNSHLYKNNQNGTFTDFANILSIPTYLNQVTGVSFADYNDDGLMDVYVSVQNGPNRLLKNEICNDNNFIKCNLIGTTSNRSAIGAIVKLYTPNGLRQLRHVIGGVGRAMESLEVEFGLGQESTFDSLVVKWPSGIYQIFYDGQLAINTKNTIVEQGCQSSIDANPNNFDFPDAPAGTMTTTSLIVINDSPCYVGITDISLEQQYNSTVSFSKTDFVMEPFSQDTVTVIYTHLFSDLNTVLSIYYNGGTPVEIPFEAGLILKNGEILEPKLPETFSLKQNFPNPFNPTTSINFELPITSKTKITVYDVNGRLVKVLTDKKLNAGYHQTIWDGTDGNGNKVSSGVYLYRMQTENFTKTNKMVLIK